MRRTVWTILALTLATALLAPTPALAQDTDPVLVVGQHALSIQKSGLDETTIVRDTIQYSVEDVAFDGTLEFTLDPDATLNTWFLTRNGTQFPGEAGQVRSGATDGMSSTAADGFERFTLDLSNESLNIRFQPDSTYGVHLTYSLPADDTTFQRQIDHPTPEIFMVVQSTPGLEPQSDDLDLRAVANTWTYNTAPREDGEPWVPGETITVELVEVDEPRNPLSVHVEAIETDPVVLRATAEGGIPGDAGYSYSWDLDGDGECDDATGETVTLDRERSGTHQATACVADARGAEAQDTYETLTIEGPVVPVGPAAWLLALLGLLIGALLVYGLVSGGIVRAGRGRPAAAAPGGRSLLAESKDMLALRQRVMVASLKELEIAKKKGEVPEGVYTPLKAELKQDTVRVMRELEKRKQESV